MNKKTTKLSATLISVLTALVCIIIYLSYNFYSNSIKEKEVTKIKSTDLLSIDSIKKASVDDTVKYFNIKIDILKNQISEKDTLIKKYQTDIQKVSRIKDSISIRLESTRMKLREIKDTIK